MKDIQLLEEKLGYTFQTRQNIKQALTHPSAGENHYQRLEFLGDAVLELSVSRVLFGISPLMNEGEMTRLRAALVCERTLAEVAGTLDLGQFIQMDKACAASGGRNNASILSDVMEAVLASVYLDGGEEAAARVISRLWQPHILSAPVRATDAKSALQEYLQGQGRGAPAYALIAESGPPHKRRFEMAVLIEGREWARGIGISKKKAEQEAARQAFTKLQQQEEKNEAKKA